MLVLYDPMQQHAIIRAKNCNISLWLPVLPLARSQFDLSEQEFKDGLALHYKKPLLSLPSVGIVVEHHLLLGIPLIVVLWPGHS